MNSDTISLEDEEMQVLCQLVAEALERGDSRELVLADLANNGIAADEAEGIVALVEFHLYEVDTQPARATRPSQDASGGGMGWLIWIAVIVGFKILSALLK